MKKLNQILGLLAIFSLINCADISAAAMERKAAADAPNAELAKLFNELDNDRLVGRNEDIPGLFSNVTEHLAKLSVAQQADAVLRLRQLVAGILDKAASLGGAKNANDLVIENAAKNMLAVYKDSDAFKKSALVEKIKKDLSTFGYMGQFPGVDRIVIDPNTKATGHGEGGWTMLFAAGSQLKNWEIVKDLILLGADVNIKTAGQTPLTYAGNKEIADLLRSVGAK